MLYFSEFNKKNIHISILLSIIVSIVVIRRTINLYLLFKFSMDCKICAFITLAILVYVCFQNKSVSTDQFTFDAFLDFYNKLTTRSEVAKIFAML